MKDQLDAVVKQYLFNVHQACAAFPIRASQIISEEVKLCCPHVRGKGAELAVRRSHQHTSSLYCAYASRMKE